MNERILNRINSPAELKRLNSRELEALAGEIRELIIDTASVTGGHLASSLGVVELAIATHRALDAPVDRIVWDVGHQAYAHKILTGRHESFGTLRQYGGLSGFPRRAESEYDVVDSGHAGGSISYGLGLALARDMLREDYSIAVIIGDGAMTSGVAYEAMNQAGHHLNSNLIIILNDNEMSISENVGGFSSYLSRIRLKPGYTHLKEELEEILTSLPPMADGFIRLAHSVKVNLTNALVPGVLFEALGLKYVGPISGYDMPLIEETIAEAREIDGPVLIHVVTKKGKGYGLSEKSPTEFHGVSQFDRKTGIMRNSDGSSYTQIFADTVVKLARRDPKLVAITAAMKLGTGLDRFSKLFPERFFDVGIAEQLGVNLAAGLALSGLRPVAAIYSTFLQRAFDQISQEICLQNLPVVFVIDRAGLVGEDGSTHHGYFDVSYLRMLPNMVVMSPGSGGELASMLEYAFQLGSPVAVRFPRGKAAELDEVGRELIVLGKGETLRSGEDVTLLALGDMVPIALGVAELLMDEGISTSVVNARFAKPLDSAFLEEICEGKKLMVTLEDNVLAGGFGSAVLETLTGKRIEVNLLRKGLPDRYIDHGKIAELLEEVGLSQFQIATDIRERLEEIT